MAEHRARRHGFSRRLRVWALAASGSAMVALAFYLALARQLPVERMRVAGAGPQAGPKTAFEPSDLSLWPIALVLAGAPALLALCCFVLMAAYPGALPDADRKLTISPPGPMLQTNTPEDMQRFRAEETKRLNDYYWVDRDHGTVHIPIEQAMRKLAQTGIPGFAEAQRP